MNRPHPHTETALWSTEGNYNDTKHDELINKQRKYDNLQLISILYDGQLRAGLDKNIKEGSLYFSRKNKNAPFTYIGIVILVHQLSNKSSNKPAKYQLIINPNISFNNIKYNTVLDKLPNISGSGCFKKSALHIMNYVLVDSIQSGINKIKQI